MSLTHSLRELTDALSALTAQHLRLARIELGSDARYLGPRVGLVVACALVAFIGYALICAALSIALATVVPLPAALAIVGLANVGVGGAGAARVVAALRARRPLARSDDALKQTLATVRGTATETR
jgi:hypothetical protein